MGYDAVLPTRHRLMNKSLPSVLNKLSIMKKYIQKLCKKEKKIKKPKQVPKTEEQIRHEWILARRALILKQ